MEPQDTPQPDPAVPPPPPQQGVPSQEERQWALFAHLSPLAGALLTLPLGGWGGFLGPLVIWLMKRDTLPFAGAQAKEALNFSITVLAAVFALMLLSFVTLGLGLILTMPLLAVIGIGALVLMIMAAVKANEGVAYRYPLTVRLLK